MAQRDPPVGFPLSTPATPCPVQIRAPKRRPLVDLDLNTVTTLPPHFRFVPPVISTEYGCKRDLPVRFHLFSPATPCPLQNRAPTRRPLVDLDLNTVTTQPPHLGFVPPVISTEYGRERKRGNESGGIEQQQPWPTHARQMAENIQEAYLRRGIDNKQCHILETTRTSRRGVTSPSSFTPTPNDELQYRYCPRCHRKTLLSEHECNGREYSQCNSCRTTRRKAGNRPRNQSLSQPNPHEVDGNQIPPLS